MFSFSFPSTLTLGHDDLTQGLLSHSCCGCHRLAQTSWPYGLVWVYDKVEGQSVLELPRKHRDGGQEAHLLPWTLGRANPAL
jgi:hypothetical protein